MKFGRYEIKFGKYAWIQTRVPTTVRRFLCFFIFKEARPHDVDKKQQFPLRTPMVVKQDADKLSAYLSARPPEDEGRVFRYLKASNSYSKGEAVEDTQEEK